MLTMVRSNPIWGFSWAGGGPGGLVGGRPRETGYAVSALKREVFRQMPAQQAPVVEQRRSITVVLVDDESLIRAALSQALSIGCLDVVGEATNGEDAVEMVVDLRPDVVLMDLRL